MAVTLPAILARLGALLRIAMAALQYTPHAALLLLFAAIVSHGLGRDGIANALGDASFFLLVAAVIVKRGTPQKESQ